MDRLTTLDTPLRRGLAVAVVLLLVVSAAVATGGRSGDVGADRSDVAANAERDRIGGAASPVQLAADAVTTVERPSAGATSESSNGARSTAPGSAPQPADAVAGSTIQIGVTTGDSAAANAALMAVTGSPNGPWSGDSTKRTEAIFSWVNSHGGAGGHTVEPVYFEVQVSDTVTKEGRNRISQAACARWTEDHDVFAMIGASALVAENALTECAHRTRTPLLMSKVDAVAYVSESRLDEVRRYYLWPAGMTAERRERTLVDALARSGSLTRPSRVGLMIQDDPYVREGVENGLVPALAALGIEPVAQAVYPDIIDSPWQTYVLQFQSNQVDTVLFTANTGGSLPPYFFMRQAENQQYAPRYGLTSDDAPAGLVLLNAPERQLQQIQAIGWAPWQDLGEGAFDSPASPSDELCRSILTAAGQPDAVDPICEGMFFLKAALDNRPTDDPSELADGVSALGTSYASVYTFGTRFGSRYDDGVRVVRDLAYSTECTCFRYTSPPRSLG